MKRDHSLLSVPLALLTALLLIAGSFLVSAALAEEKSDVSGVSPLAGEWAFEYEPAVLILRVSEDGSAWYRGTDYVWEDQEGFLKLSDPSGEQESVLLRYAVSEEQKIIYPRTSYHRGKEVEGQNGLIGIWEGVSDGSNFVFTPSGYFLEDSSFSGNFMINEENGTFLLHYGDLFADTLCYFSITDEILTVEYPWRIVEYQP